MPSKIEICNLALLALGQRKLNSIDEQTPSARLCRDIFDHEVETTLRAAPWKCAKKIETLGLIANETIPGWSFLYQHPPKCLFVRKVFTEASVKSPTPDEFEVLLSPVSDTKAIAANISPAYVEYTKKIENTELFDLNLVDALVYKMAAFMAVPLTQDQNLVKTMLGAYQAVVDQARLVNRNEGYLKPVAYSSILDAR
jgi:hypothetical protein